MYIYAYSYKLNRFILLAQMGYCWIHVSDTILFLSG